MNEIGMPVDGQERSGARLENVHSGWGKDIEEERKSKTSCQNQTRRRSSGYLAYLIGTRNESMKQVLTRPIPSLTTFPKEIESASPNLESTCQPVSRYTAMEKTSSIRWSILNNRFFLTISLIIILLTTLVSRFLAK